MFAELYGATGGTVVSRNDALSVPAVRRGRNIICAIGAMPLEQVGPDNVLVDSALLRQIDLDVTNVVTISQTVEDLLLEAVSWWEVTSTDFAGFPVAAKHLDVKSVSINPPNTTRSPAPLPSGLDPRDGVVWVDGKPVPWSRVIRFDSPNPAVLKHAGREIRRAILLDKAAGMYADDPRPLDYFTPAEGAEELDDDETVDFLNRWKSARKNRTTAYIPASAMYHSVDTPAPRDLQLVELSKQASLDIANALGIDPEDLGLSTTSRTYANDVDRRRNRLNDVLSPYMRAITDRLSMGDVTRRGYRVRFNVTEYLQPNPTDRWAVYSVAKGMGAMELDEIRSAEGLPPLPEQPEPEPVEVPVNSLTDEETVGVDAASAAAHTFDDAGLTFVDVPVSTFSVDREGRVIEGVVLPYGKASSDKGGIRYMFERGALQWDAENPGRVKLLRDHDYTQPLGKAIQLRDTNDGVLARFKVGRGKAGDEALELAEDGVLDGLSVGVDFDGNDVRPDAKDRTLQRVRRADWREVSLTAMPSFDDARVTHVAASRTNGGGPVPDTDTEPDTAPDSPDPAEPVAATFTAEQVSAMFASLNTSPDPDPERPATVNPTRGANLSVTHEAVPYRFDRGGNFVPEQEHVFSQDLHEMALVNDIYGTNTEAGRRVMQMLRHEFVVTTDVDELNPTIQRPDMYVDQRDYKYPIWNAINRGAPPNGVNPFGFPKYNSSSGLVGDHVEGTEPTGGTQTTTGQTVQPTGISGKAHITREVWDMGGNPAVSTLIWNQMVRGYREGLESAAATFLNTLVAAVDINLGVAATDAAFVAAWENALASLQFVRGYDFEVFVLDQTTYLKFANATASDGRKYYPQINPMNANGTSARRFTQLDLSGVIGLPSWALPSTPGAANNSWLFDPSTVHGWATPPQRLEFPGATQAGAYAPVAFVDLAIFGYKALANSDLGGVRQVIYDSV